MKRLISFVIMAIMFTSLSGCGSSNAVESNTTPTSDALSEKQTAKILTAEQVIVKLQEAGLPISNVVVYNEKSDPNGKLGRPDEYTSKANFSDPAHEDIDKTSPDNTIEVFTTEADAKLRAEYVKSVTKGTMISQYIYQIGVYVLRIDYDVLPADAQKYEQALSKTIN